MAILLHFDETGINNEECEVLVSATSKNEFTIAFWIMLSSSDQTGHEHNIIGNSDNGAICIYLDQYDRINLWSYNSGYGPLYADLPLSKSAWHYVAVTYQTGGAIIYVDQQPYIKYVMGHAEYVPDWFSESYPLYLGVNPGAMGGWTGWLRQLVYSQTYWDQSQDQAMYNNGLGQPTVLGIAPAIDQWQMNEGAGTICYDSISNKHLHLVAGSQGIYWDYAGNVWAEQMHGGVKCNGSAIVKSTYFKTTSGGVFCNGVAAGVFNSVPTPTVGVLCSGASRNGYQYEYAGQGGVLCNGVATWEEVFRPLLSGGVKCNGVALVSQYREQTTSGGVLCNGVARVGWQYEYAGQGGVLCNGIATTDRIYAPHLSGGVVCNGRAIRTSVFYWTPTGGVKCGGSTGGSYLYEPTGGVLCNGSAILIYVPRFPFAIGGGVHCGVLTRRLYYEYGQYEYGKYDIDHQNAIVFTARYLALNRNHNGVLCDGQAVIEVTRTPCVVTGGVLCNGKAIIKATSTPLTRGGVLCGGSIVFGQGTTGITGGGVLCAGSAEVLYHALPETSGGVICPLIERQLAPIGQDPFATFSILDTATIQYLANPETTGGVLCNGHGEIIDGATITSVLGGVLCTGKAVITSAYTFSGNGELDFTGDSTEQIVNRFIGSGQIVFSATYQEQREYQYKATGFIQLNGYANQKLNVSVVASGELKLNGQAIRKPVYDFTGNGNLILSGKSADHSIYEFESTGCILFSGISFNTPNYTFASSGTLILTGSAILTRFYCVSNGPLILSGRSTVSPTYLFVGKGEIDFCSNLCHTLGGRIVIKTVFSGRIRTVVCGRNVGFSSLGQGLFFRLGSWEGYGPDARIKVLPAFTGTLRSLPASGDVQTAGVFGGQIRTLSAGNMETLPLFGGRIKTTGEGQTVAYSWLGRGLCFPLGDWAAYNPDARITVLPVENTELITT